METKESNLRDNLFGKSQPDKNSIAGSLNEKIGKLRAAVTGSKQDEETDDTPTHNYWDESATPKWKGKEKATILEDNILSNDSSPSSTSAVLGISSTYNPNEVTHHSDLWAIGQREVGTSSNQTAHLLPEILEHAKILKAVETPDNLDKLNKLDIIKDF